MEDFTQNITDALPEAAFDCQPSLGPADCTDTSETAQHCDKEKCQDLVEVFFPTVDEFIKDCQDGSMCIRHVKCVVFYGETEEDVEGGFADPFVPGGSLEENLSEEVLAAENQEKIFSALCSVWNLISEWDLEKPIILAISGRYFRSNDKHLADLAHQKNIWRLACEDAVFANPLDILKIAKRIPELQHLGTHVGHMNKQLRIELANDMRTWKTTLPKLKDLTLHGDDEPFSRGDERKLQDMREDGIDMLCRELRLLTQQDGFLGLELNFVPISAELFEDTQNPEDEMKRPTLRRMDIRVHEMSSTGKWLFSPVPGSRGTCFLDAPETVFFKRTEPVQEEIQPLADLFERTWKMMPKLESSKGVMYYDEGVNGPVKVFREVRS